MYYEGQIIGDFTLLEKYYEKERDMMHYVFKCNVCGVTRTQCGRVRHSSCKHDRNCVGVYVQTCNYPEHAKTLLQILRRAKQKCENPNNGDYPLYGARGICLDYEPIRFLQDMLDDYVVHVNLHGRNDTTLGRIDNNSHYCPGNVRWETRKQQQSNRRVTLTYTVISPTGEVYENIKSLTQFAAAHNLGISGIRHAAKGRVQSYKGWKVQIMG